MPGRQTCQVLAGRDLFGEKTIIPVINVRAMGTTIYGELELVVPRRDILELDR